MTQYTTLAALEARLNTVVEQIANEKLTGDSFTDYKIRYATGDLCAERNRLKQQAFEEFGVSR